MSLYSSPCHGPRRKSNRKEKLLPVAERAQACFQSNEHGHGYGYSKAPSKGSEDQVGGHRPKGMPLELWEQLLFPGLCSTSPGNLAFPGPAHYDRQHIPSGPLSQGQALSSSGGNSMLGPFSFGWLWFRTTPSHTEGLLLTLHSGNHFYWVLGSHVGN